MRIFSDSVGLIGILMFLTGLGLLEDFPVAFGVDIQGFDLALVISGLAIFAVALAFKRDRRKQ